jgi:transmembrane sensor
VSHESDGGTDRGRPPLPVSDRPEIDGIDWGTIARHVTGRGTPADAAAVAAWLAADVARAPERRRVVGELHALWSTTAAAAEVGDYDAQVEWTRFERAHGLARHDHPQSGVITYPRAPAGSAPSVSGQHARTRPRGVGEIAPSLWARLLAVGTRAARPQSLIAAMIVITVGVGLAVGSLWHRTSVAPLGREYATTAGQRLSVTLVDGTRFTLAPASRVRVATNYGQGARGVELEGEAYFAVMHDAAHPFAVRAHGAVARDIGTAFDVRAYPEEAGARIAVAEGAVSVTPAGRCGAGVRAEGEPCGAEARAGDVATAGDGRVAVERGVDVASLTGWTRGELTFRNVALGEVTTDLSRWFGVEIRLADPALARRLVTATVTDEPLDAALNVLAPGFGTTYERQGRVVVLRPQSR